MESSKCSECSVPGTSVALIDIICYTIPQDRCVCRLLQCQCRHQFFILFSELALVIFHPTFHRMFVYLSANLFSSGNYLCFATCLLYTVLKKETFQLKVIDPSSLFRQKRPVFCLTCVGDHWSHGYP